MPRPCTFRNSPMRRGGREPASRCPTTWSCSRGPSSCPCIPSGASWERCSPGPWPSRWEEVPAGEQRLRAGRRSTVWLQPQSRLLRDDHAGKTARGHQCSAAAAAGPRGPGRGAGRAGAGACRLRGRARAAPVGAVPGARAAAAGGQPGGAGRSHGAVRERRGETAARGRGMRAGGEGGEAGQLRPGVMGAGAQRPLSSQIYAYASAVFSQAGIPQDKIQYAAIGTGGCELLATLLSCLVIERAGRRVLLTGGYGLMTCWGSVFTVALCLQGSFSWMAYLAMACIFAFILSFGIGPAGVTGILATELFDQMARPAAYMVCGALMWTMLFLVGLVFPFIMEGLSHFIYVPFLCVCVCAAVYSGIFLPETRGKSFMEISEELHRLNFPGRSRGPAWAGPEVVRSTEL
ncbi:solute carrier family 2, facilitated glucose transporter member 11 isoform X9 [Bos javanicus]|uniref:solute carrier family 2, facilitated glucose transporter member 11 isoform X9 n=1 Tax=Bos javanicus TaxID=9906 RepID=UPI002AA70F49|nr:solute carrier family 2, facilitated glucose transporter member 11 isoform X9 [Bos javanicus]